MKDKFQVVFFGPDGPGRSQMAAGLLQEAAGDLVEVCYYGESQKHSDPWATAALEELGIDVDDSGARTTLEDKDVDLAVVIDRVKCGGVWVELASVPLPETLRAKVDDDGTQSPLPLVGWPVEDPALVTGSERRTAAYRRARFELSDHVDVLVGHGYLNLLVQSARRLT